MNIATKITSSPEDREIGEINALIAALEAKRHHLRIARFYAGSNKLAWCRARDNADACQHDLLMAIYAVCEIDAVYDAAMALPDPEDVE